MTQDDDRREAPPALDRAYQRDLLRMLADRYPDRVWDDALLTGKDARTRDANVTYLAEHGLLHASWAELLSGRELEWVQATMTGLDFLADDGGLSAVLGVVTVRLHDETIKDLLVSKVQSTEGDPDAKRQLVSAIKALPAEATKAVAMRLLQAGLDRAPHGLASLRTLIGL